jgi:hypothetical protein
MPTARPTRRRRGRYRTGSAIKTTVAEATGDCARCGLASDDRDANGLCLDCRRGLRPRWHAASGQPPPPEPCLDAPGSDGKIETLRWRLEHGYALHQPDDARDAVNTLPYDANNDYRGGGPSRPPRVYRRHDGPGVLEAERVNDLNWQAGGR